MLRMTKIMDGTNRYAERGDAKARGVTSVSVAAAAGVSQSTVSLVMSGKSEGRVSPEVRTLVEETARRLGYQPNASAQMLRTGVLKVLALAVPNVRQPYFGEVLVAAELAARENDYSVLLVDTTNDMRWVERLIGMIRGRLVAGCIVYASEETVEQALRDVRDQIVFIEAEDGRESCIDLDIAASVREVVEHLAGLGHRRIGYFAADYPKATFRRRFGAFRAELERLGLLFEDGWRAVSRFELEPATERALALLHGGAITALFCDDDLLAAAAYRAARELKLRIPEDLSVVGFNDIEVARVLSPELTTVAIPAEEVARGSIELLLEQMTSGIRQSAPRVLPLQLKIRGSTGLAAPCPASVPGG